VNSPLHSRVREDKRRHEVKDLVPAPPHRVPEALREGVGEGSLSVRAQGVGGDALSGLAAAFIWVAPAADVPSVEQGPSALRL
jgi:hypothetical protein